MVVLFDFSNAATTQTNGIRQLCLLLINLASLNNHQQRLDNLNFSWDITIILQTKCLCFISFIVHICIMWSGVMA